MKFFKITLLLVICIFTINWIIDYYGTTDEVESNLFTIEYPKRWEYIYENNLHNFLINGDKSLGCFQISAFIIDDSTYQFDCKKEIEIYKWPKPQLETLNSNNVISFVLDTGYYSEMLPTKNDDLIYCWIIGEKDKKFYLTYTTDKRFEDNDLMRKELEAVKQVINTFTILKSDYKVDI